MEDVEFATLEWAWWLRRVNNNHRLLEPNGHLPPVEKEQEYYRNLSAPEKLAVLN